MALLFNNQHESDFNLILSLLEKTIRRLINFIYEVSHQWMKNITITFAKRTSEFYTCVINHLKNIEQFCVKLKHILHKLESIFGEARLKFERIARIYEGVGLLLRDIDKTIKASGNISQGVIDKSDYYGTVVLSGLAVVFLPATMGTGLYLGAFMTYNALKRLVSIDITKEEFEEFLNTRIYQFNEQLNDFNTIVEDVGNTSEIFMLENTPQNNPRIIFHN